MLSMKTLDSKDASIGRLLEQTTRLEEDKLRAMQLQAALEVEIASQKDPIWVEMMLIKKLGVVPEGCIKVKFKKDELETMGGGW